MIEKRRLKNVIIFIQTILSFALSRKTNICLVFLFKFSEVKDQYETLKKSIFFLTISLRKAPA